MPASPATAISPRSEVFLRLVNVSDDEPDLTIESVLQITQRNGWEACRVKAIPRSGRVRKVHVDPARVRELALQGIGARKIRAALGLPKSSLSSVQRVLKLVKKEILASNSHETPSLYDPGLAETTTLERN